MLGWILLAIFLLLLIICITTVRAEISYGRVAEHDELTLEASVWFGLIRFHRIFPHFNLKGSKEGPVLETKEKQEEQDELKTKQIDKHKMQKFHQRYTQTLERFHDFQPIVKKMMSHIRCLHLEWHTTLGLGDAAETGALSGAVWGVKNIVVAYISHSITLLTVPRISVQPVWNNKCIRTRFRCIVTFRLGYAMVAGIRLLLKLRKGREHKWRTTPSRA